MLVLGIINYDNIIVFINLHKILSYDEKLFDIFKINILLYFQNKAR